MKLDLDTHIDAPIDLVWTVLADEFTQVATWLPSVVRSYELPDTEPTAGAPVAGRVCEFTDDEDGLKALETITHWSDDAHRLDIDVVVENAPVLLPVARNVARFRLQPTSEGTTVHLAVEPTLKPHGYLMYPLLRRNFAQQFGGLLTQLKAHVESRQAA